MCVFGKNGCSYLIALNSLTCPEGVRPSVSGLPSGLMRPWSHGLVLVWIGMLLVGMAASSALVYSALLLLRRLNFN